MEYYKQETTTLCTLLLYPSAYVSGLQTVYFKHIRNFFSFKKFKFKHYAQNIQLKKMFTFYRMYYHLDETWPLVVFQSLSKSKKIHKVQVFVGSENDKRKQ